ncbi:Hypothetical protein ACI5QL_03637 [Bacillus velezensis]
MHLRSVILKKIFPLIGYTIYIGWPLLLFILKIKKSSLFL